MDAINYVVISVVGGADGGVSSDICGIVAEPFVQTSSGRRTQEQSGRNYEDCARALLMAAFQ